MQSEEMHLGCVSKWSSAGRRPILEPGARLSPRAAEGFLGGHDGGFCAPRAA